MDFYGLGWTWMDLDGLGSFLGLPIPISSRSQLLGPKQPSVTPAKSMINASPTVSHSNGLARPIGKVARF